MQREWIAASFIASALHGSIAPFAHPPAQLAINIQWAAALESTLKIRFIPSLLSFGGLMRQVPICIKWYWPKRHASKMGRKIVVIDVHKNQTGRLADWFIPILPGTDSALAFGMMHILFAENMVDDDFLQQYTVGHEELREHVVQYDPLTVSGITGVPVEDIYKLARMYGKTSPSFIRIGNGPQHHDNGGMFVRTISCLPALTGQWLVKGGGAIKGNSGYLAQIQ